MRVVRPALRSQNRGVRFIEFYGIGEKISGLFCEGNGS